jgi:hypothetical protein
LADELFFTAVLRGAVFFLATGFLLESKAAGSMLFTFEAK